MLREDAGFSRSLLLTLAVIAGVSVANLYYNQPLLEMLRTELRTSTLEANHIALFTQGGYALGLFFIIPLADLVSRRRIVLVNFSVLVLSLLAIAAARNIVTIQFFSFLTGLCSVMPHIFIPFAAQYSRPADKSRNVGIILSGLLSGILASRVVSGAVGEVLGWREMYCIAAGLMVLSALVILRVLPDTPRNFTGGYGALMRSLATLFLRYAALRLHALRAALAFGSFMCFWASLAFKMAEAPFHAGSDVVGLLGLCGIAGAVTASRVGVYIPRFSVRRLSAAGSLLQLVAWGLFGAGAGSYAAIIAGIVLIDIGMQAIQLCNQTPLFGLEPQASNRINTLFMSIYFIGGAFGTLLSGLTWSRWGWPGVVAAGAVLALASLLTTLRPKRQHTAASQSHPHKKAERTWLSRPPHPFRHGSADPYSGEYMSGRSFSSSTCFFATKSRKSSSE